jgi:hypothetical protein
MSAVALHTSLPENESVEGKLIDEINRAQLNWNKNRSGKRKTIQTLRPMLRHRSATRFAQRNKMNSHGSDLRRIGFSSSWKIAKVKKKWSAFCCPIARSRWKQSYGSALVRWKAKDRHPI